MVHCCWVAARYTTNNMWQNQSFSDELIQKPTFSIVSHAVPLPHNSAITSSNRFLDGLFQLPYSNSNFLHRFMLVLRLVVQMCSTLLPHGLWPPGSMGFSRQEYWMGCHALLQGIFPTQGLKPSLPHCRQILYLNLSHQGSLRILEWVAYPFSKRTSQPRNRTRVSCIASIFFTSWATRETLP